MTIRRTGRMLAAAIMCGMFAGTVAGQATGLMVPDGYVNISHIRWIVGVFIAGIVGLFGAYTWLVRVLIEKLEQARSDQVKTAEKALPVASKLVDMLPILTECLRGAIQHGIAAGGKPSDGGGPK